MSLDIEFEISTKTVRSPWILSVDNVDLMKFTGYFMNHTSTQLAEMTENKFISDMLKLEGTAQ